MTMAVLYIWGATALFWALLCRATFEINKPRLIENGWKEKSQKMNFVSSAWGWIAFALFMFIPIFRVGVWYLLSIAADYTPEEFERKYRK